MKKKLLTDERSSHKKQQTFSAEFYLPYTQPLVLAALPSCLLLYLQLYLLIRCGQQKNRPIKTGKYIYSVFYSWGFFTLYTFLPCCLARPLSEAADLGQWVTTTMSKVTHTGTDAKFKLPDTLENTLNPKFTCLNSQQLLLLYGCFAYTKPA